MIWIWCFACWNSNLERELTAASRSSHWSAWRQLTWKWRWNDKDFRPTNRPHSVSFLGKETDTATPLRLENFGRIDFSLGRWITRGKKTPKSMTPYAKVPGELVRIFFHSLLWPQRSLLYGLPPNCTKQSVFLTLQLDRICQKIEFHICQQCSFSGSTLPWLVFCMEITASLPAVVPFLATQS